MRILDGETLSSLAMEMQLASAAVVQARREFTAASGELEKAKRKRNQAEDRQLETRRAMQAYVEGVR
jgi:hypothetical protein